MKDIIIIIFDPIKFKQASILDLKGQFNDKGYEVYEIEEVNPVRALKIEMLIIK